MYYEAAYSKSSPRHGGDRKCCVRKTENPDFATKDALLVGWETRERGTSYYTRSWWVDGRVVREYIGTGPLGEIVASDDELKRRQKEESVAYWREKRERLEQDAAFLKELEKVAEILTRAHLLASGCHKRKGEWRKKRGKYDAS